MRAKRRTKPRNAINAKAEQPIAESPQQKNLNAQTAQGGEVRAGEFSTAAKLTIFTIGHSTRSIEEFVTILSAHKIEQLVDVRTIPKSRRVPQFNSDALARELKNHGIAYVHLKTLGGLRHARKDSINTGWRNASFRGYADYMATDDFREGLARLMELASAKRSAIMCAEAVPWRCHRSLIGDALLVRGVHVEDIMSATSVRPHELTSFARVSGDSVTYPGEQLELPTARGTEPIGEEHGSHEKSLRAKKRT